MASRQAQKKRRGPPGQPDHPAAGRCFLMVRFAAWRLFMPAVLASCTTCRSSGTRSCQEQGRGPADPQRGGHRLPGHHLRPERRGAGHLRHGGDGDHLSQGHRRATWRTRRRSIEDPGQGRGEGRELHRPGGQMDEDYIARAWPGSWAWRRRTSASGWRRPYSSMRSSRRRLTSEPTRSARSSTARSIDGNECQRTAARAARHLPAAGLQALLPLRHPGGPGHRLRQQLTNDGAYGLEATYDGVLDRRPPGLTVTAKNAAGTEHALSATSSTTTPRTATTWS